MKPADGAGLLDRAWFYLVRSGVLLDRPGRLRASRKHCSAFVYQFQLRIGAPRARARPVRRYNNTPALAFQN
jgi:hypothetical protein